MERALPPRRADVELKTASSGENGPWPTMGFDLTIPKETYILKSFVSGSRSLHGRVRETRVYDEGSTVFSRSLF
jgi:hypothetical protein